MSNGKSLTVMSELLDVSSVADAGSYTITNKVAGAEITFEGDGTLVLPTVLVNRRQYQARVSTKAAEGKELIILNPSFTIYGDTGTILAGDNLVLAPSELVKLEVISSTELEAIIWRVA